MLGRASSYLVAHIFRSTLLPAGCTSAAHIATTSSSSRSNGGRADNNSNSSRRVPGKESHLEYPDFHVDNASASTSGTHEGSSVRGGSDHMHAHDRSASSSSSSSTTSSSSSSEDASTQQLQQELCAAALPYVHQLGWSQAALLAGAKDLGLSPAVIGVLPRQQASLVEYLIQQHNQQLVQQLQGMQQELAGMGTTAKVRTAVKARLEMLGPYINTWPQALSILARPRNSVAALQLLATLVDDIWYHAAGDTSTDTSWYTKRALLAAVYSSTELFMLTDFTPHFQDTWEFLDRRLGDVAALGKASRGVTGVTQGLGEALAALATSRNPVIPGPPRPFV